MGELTFQNGLIGMATLGLFFTLIGILMSGNGLGNNYDLTGYDEDSLSDYMILGNLSADVQSIQNDVDVVTVDKNIFDYFAGIFSAILTPFKTMYRSVRTTTLLASTTTKQLNLLPVIGDYLITVITILVVIGLVMIKYYQNKNKNG